MRGEPRAPTRLDDEAALARAWMIASALVAALGLVAELGEYLFDAPPRVVELFSLSYEANVPTWYASVLLFSCALVLGSIARIARAKRGQWGILGAIFAYLSLDEAIEIHEHLGALVPSRVIYFGWVVPAAIVVALVGVAYVPFLRALDAATRRRFVVAGAIYVGGALGMELPLGLWTGAYGDDNLGYGLIDFAEESMELAGATLFLRALLAHRDARRSAP